jgi:hypothetical protein
MVPEEHVHAFWKTLVRIWPGNLRIDPGDGKLRIPMMSISHSDLMPIRTERSDAGLSQCETVIDISQEFSWFSAPPFGFRSFLQPHVFGR